MVINWKRKSAFHPFLTYVEMRYNDRDNQGRKYKILTWKEAKDMWLVG